VLCEYRYDATGRLASQIVPDKPETSLFYRGESIIATKAGDRRTSYLSDGKTYWVDSHAQDSVQYQSYTPYGFSAPPGPDIAFNGQWRDPITGWYHLGNGYRVYNPLLHHYHTPDPWSPFTSGEPNPYLYCLSDPINRVDPSGHFSIFGIDINWRTFLGAVIGIAASIAVGVLTAGASLAVEIAVGAAVGGVTSVVSGVIGDLADGKTPTWTSAGLDLAGGLAGGILGPLAGRAWNAASKAIQGRLMNGFLGGMTDLLPSGVAAAGMAATGAASRSIWRSGLKESLETIRADALFHRATEASVKSFFYKSLPLKAVLGMGSDLIFGSDDASSTSDSQSQSRSSSQDYSPSGSAQAGLPNPLQVVTPYVSRGSNLARDTIRPLQKDGSSSGSSFTMSESVADILTLSSRILFALSRKGGGSRSDTASFDDLRARIRAASDWNS
jgi:RHS repeat-associated protein